MQDDERLASFGLAGRLSFRGDGERERDSEREGEGDGDGERDSEREGEGERARLTSCGGLLPPVGGDGGLLLEVRHCPVVLGGVEDEAKRLARTLQLRAPAEPVVLASRSGPAVAALPPVSRLRLRATGRRWGLEREAESGQSHAQDSRRCDSVLQVRGRDCE